MAAGGEVPAEVGEGAGGGGFSALVEDTQKAGRFFFEVVEGFAGGGGGCEVGEGSGQQGVKVMCGLHRGSHGCAEFRKVGGERKGFVGCLGCIKGFGEGDFAEGVEGGGAGEGEGDFGAVEEINFA